MTGRVAVIGGGLAGGITALHLARAGRDVILLEKSKGPHHKVCGEFLSHEALHYLHGAAIDLDALGAAAIHRVRLIAPAFQAEAALPFPARSLSRNVLDEVLLDRAAAAGARVERGTRVQGLTPVAQGWHVLLPDREPLEAHTAILATGKLDVHGLPRPAGTHTGLVGFKMLFRLSTEQQQQIDGTVELILFPGGYAGLQPVEHGAANLSLLVTAAQLKHCGGNWPALLSYLQRTAPHLATRLQAAQNLLPAPLTISSIPYGFVQRTAPDGLWRIGDQAAVIPSFSGDGMAIALHSGTLAARCLLAGRSPAVFQQTLAAHIGGRLALATTLSRILVNQPGLAHAVRLWPGLLTRIASATRIPQKALLPARATAVHHTLRASCSG